MLIDLLFDLELRYRYVLRTYIINEIKPQHEKKNYIESSTRYVGILLAVYKNCRRG